MNFDHITPVAHDSEGNPLYSKEQMDEVLVAARFEFSLHQLYEGKFYKRTEEAIDYKNLLREYCASKLEIEEYKFKNISSFDGEITDEINSKWFKDMEPMIHRHADAINAIEKLFRDENGLLRP